MLSLYLLTDRALDIRMVTAGILSDARLAIKQRQLQVNLELLQNCFIESALGHMKVWLHLLYASGIRLKQSIYASFTSFRLYVVSELF